MNLNKWRLKVTTWKVRLMCWTLSLTLLLGRIALADCQQTLDLAVRAEKAYKVTVEERDRELALCKLGLTQAIDADRNLAVDNADKDRQLSSPIRNPFIMATLGIVVGLVVGGLALRK